MNPLRLPKRARALTGGALAPLREHGFAEVAVPESFLVDSHNHLLAGEADLPLTGLRRTISISASVMCPPSSTGMGSRLSSARFTFMNTLNQSASRQPSSLLSRWK